jgi:hypothetical protein
VCARHGPRSRQSGRRRTLWCGAHRDVALTEVRASGSRPGHCRCPGRDEYSRQRIATRRLATPMAVNVTLSSSSPNCQYTGNWLVGSDQ